MKRNIYYIPLLLLAVMITSCMGESEEKITYQRYGVVMSQPYFCFYTTDGEEATLVSSPEVENIEGIAAGDCYELVFRANFAGRADDQIYTVEMLSAEPVAEWELETMEDFLPDSIATDREQFFTPNLRKAQLIRGRLFLPLELKERRLEQRDYFRFEYNPDSIAIEGERRVYSLYLRALQEEASDSVIGKWIQTDALILDSFIEQAGATEKEAGRDSLHFRLNYPNRFSVDSLLIRYTAADVYSIKL